MSVDEPSPPEWRPTTDDLMNAIAAASARRRADCPGFIAEFVEVYASDRTPEELDAKWVELVGEFPWYAEDVLHCLDVTLAEGDQGLPEIVCDLAQAQADGGEVVREINVEEWRALGRGWLEDARRRFRPVFDDLSR